MVKVVNWQEKVSKKMSSELYMIDYYANNINSIFHKSSAGIKLVFVALFIILVITSGLAKVLLYLLLVIIISKMSKLPLKSMLKFILFPMLFALVFAVSYSEFDYALLTMVRVCATTSALLWLVMTTKYTEIFYAMSRISSLISTHLFIAYTLLFRIIAKIDSKVKILAIRGHKSANLKRRIRNTVNLIGYMFLILVDEAESTFNIMRVRGFKNKIPLMKKQGMAKESIVIALLILIIAFIKIY